MSYPSKNRSIYTAWTAIVLAAALLASGPSPAAAQGDCAQYKKTLLDTTESCVNEPWRPRASSVQTFRWKGHDYLIFNRGNELALYQVDNPANPVYTDTSSFDFDNRGDSDYDLIRFDVCDDCQFGILAHKLERTVVFDLGVGATPNFGGWAIYEANESIAGGYMFLKGGQQYLIAADLPGGCSLSGLYMVSGPNQLDLLECLEVDGLATTIKGLNTISDASGVLYLYAAERAGPVHVFRADGAGAALTLAYETSPAGMFGRSFELSIDTKNKRAASADFYGEVVHIWDLSFPDDPDWLYDVPVQAETVSLRSPSANAPSTLFTAIVGWPASTNTFTVEATGWEEVVDPNFWADDSLPHNPPQVCVFESGGALSRDGSVLFLSRYAVHQVFDLSECLTPMPAEAFLDITPGGQAPIPPVFPGESIEVRDKSTGVIDEGALWITRNGILDAGDDQLNQTYDRTIEDHPIPQDLSATDVFVAHVEVDSTELTPAIPYYERTVNIDRTPQASFTIAPEAVVVGDTVTLTATAEGIVGTAGYQWQITDPSGSTASRSGEVVTYTLDESGDWDFVLTVGYDHEDEVSYPDLYTATDSILNYPVSSVAAEFSWTPASPLHTLPITLDGSASRPSSGLTYEWQVKLGATVVHECGESTAKQCTIPADTLDPDTTYDVTLTVSNGTEFSTKPDVMFVGNGNVNPIISWSPSNPEIGESVGFSILGVPADLDSASWNMGGPGCDGADSTPSCTPGWNNCKYQSYKYSSSGTKTVTLSVVVGGNTFTAPPVQVSVQASGSCSPTTPPPNCTYTLSQPSVELGPGGGEAVVAVNTQSGCSWTASTATQWITILAPTGSTSGSGSLRIRADQNTGPYRTGSVIAGGQGLAVHQRPPDVPAYFEMSNQRPLIGEVVTFSVDPILEVASWDFGEADCRDNDPEINCYFLPGSACSTIRWTFPTKGSKTVTMTLTDGRTKTRTPLVSNDGQCCLADGRPDADFTMSADEAYNGETITFTDLSAKVATDFTKAISFGWNPQNPEIGESVSFSLDGVVGDIERATWDFGGDGCDGADSTPVCTPGSWNNCLHQSFAYSSSGTKSVSVTVELEGGGTESVGPLTLTVANAGECETGGGGGPVCSYVINPTVAPTPFPHTGGSGSFGVTTTLDCEWSAITYSPWVHIASGGGFGSGAVQYTVDANPGASTRTTTIWVEGKSFRLTQTGDAGDTAPSEWRWTVTRVVNEDGETVDEDYYSSTDQHTSYRFPDPGRYRVSLTAINCYGTSTTHRYVEIIEAPVENFVIGAAISQAGANNTRWETDFRFFNPCDEFLDVSLVYQPDNQNNSAKLLSAYPFTLGPNETIVFPNAREVVNEEPINGSILIDSVSESGCKVLSVSRTFNDTPDGTLGLFVPAMPVTSVGVETLNLTGLIRDNDYRSNLRLVNNGDEAAWVRITVIGKHGEALTAGKSVLVQSHSTKQINDVAGWAGIDVNLSQFTVLAEVRTEDAIIDGFATVIDNISGDSVMNSSSYLDEPVIWLPGVVHGPGKNDTLWQTDIWFHNPEPTHDWLASEATYLHGKNAGINYVFEYPDDWPAVEAMGLRRRLGIAGSILDDLGLESTSGYMIFEGLEGLNAPQIAARTYTSDENRGTYGLHLPAFGPKDLLQVGDVGYIVGVSNSADSASGFRTNFGMLATDRTAEVEVTFFYPDGTQAPEPWITTIWAGQSKQVNNVFSKFGLGNETVTGSFRIEVLSGGDLIIYATEIDNQIGDSIFIPAQQRYFGLAP